MRRAAAMAAEAGADIIDLNMGCPVKKVCRTGAGVALLDDPDRAVAVARAAGEGSGLPVTVKLRPGRDPGDRAGMTLARRLVDEAGVAGIAFHPRHASQGHCGRPDYALARELAESLPGAPDRVRRPLLGRAGPRRLRGERRRRGDARPRLARQPLALLPPARRATHGEPSHDEVIAGAGVGHRPRGGAPRRERAGRYLRKFYPWYADTLGLTRRRREPLVTAPTTAHARAVLETLGTPVTVS